MNIDGVLFTSAEVLNKYQDLAVIKIALVLFCNRIDLRQNQWVQVGYNMSVAGHQQSCNLDLVHIRTFQKSKQPQNFDIHWVHVLSSWNKSVTDTVLTVLCDDSEAQRNQNQDQCQFCITFID